MGGLDERAARMALCALQPLGSPQLSELVQVHGAVEVWEAVVGRDAESPWGRRAAAISPERIQSDTAHCRARFLVPDDDEWPESLKMLEGVAETVVELARYAYKEKLRWRAGLAMLSSGIQKLKDVTDWEQYGGAPVLGFDRPFIKAHGRSGARAITNAGKVAAKAVTSGLGRAIEEGLPK